MNKKSAIFLIISLLILGLFYLVLSYFFKEEEVKDTEFLKKYEVNEFIYTYISDQKMAEIYLNDYIYTMFSDPNKAYDLLDQEYRNKRFGSFDEFKLYVNSLNYSTYKLDRYYKTTSEGYTVFGVYDKNGNHFIFKTKGVMQYSVYLDDYTIEF